MSARGVKATTTMIDEFAQLQSGAIYWHQCPFLLGDKNKTPQEFCHQCKHRLWKVLGRRCNSVLVGDSKNPSFNFARKA